jgi:hypothetical protein
MKSDCSCRYEIEREKLNSFLTKPSLIYAKEQEVSRKGDQDDLAYKIALYACDLRISPREIGQVA